MADVFAHHTKAKAFGICLNRMRDVGNPTSLACMLDSFKEALLRDVNQQLRFPADLAARIGCGAVAVPRKDGLAPCDRMKW